MRAPRDWNDPLALAIGATVLAGGSFLPTAIRLVVTPLALMWPGHCLRVAIFGAGRIGHRFDGGREATDAAEAADSAGQSASAGSPGDGQDRDRFNRFPTFGLNLLLTLLIIPIASLAVVTTGMRLTHNTTVAAVAAAMAVSTGVVALRERMSVTVATRSSRIAPDRSVVIGACAIAAMLIVAWATVRFLERPQSAGFTQFELAGPWALARSVVDVPTDSALEIAFRVQNNSGRDDEYTVRGRVVDASGSVVSTWEPVARELRDGQSWDGQISGEILEQPCRQRAELTLTSKRGPVGINIPGVQTPPGVAQEWDPLEVVVVPLTDRCHATPER